MVVSEDRLCDGRTPPPPDLFTVPSDYKIVDQPYVQKLQEVKKMLDAGHAGGGRGNK